jgi:hypothetical protein
MKSKSWKASKDPLFRGDVAHGVRPPVSTANDSFVRHVLYLEGPGRETPYLSTSEDLETAKRFGPDGAVWITQVARAKAASVGHIGNSELLNALKGNGKGKAKWPDPFEVMQARRYVEQWSEHLLDFRKVQDTAAVAAAIFQKK